MASNDDLLKSIDSKLSALVALMVEAQLRQAGATRSKERSLDQLLSEAGLSAATVGGLLGKTERAVHLQLQRGRQGKGRGTSKRGQAKKRDGS